jgi:hypothetical protein
MRIALLTLFVLLLGATAAPADGWAEKMFEDGKKTSHDFGNVPRGAQLFHRFTITNIYAVPMEITGIVPSCGCTEAKPSKRVLAPRESATIDVTMDARRFTGAKTVTIKVSVGPEFVSTAELTITAQSRADLVFNPGELSFGSVTRGQSAEQVVDVDYAGTMDWQITEAVAKDLPMDIKLEKKQNKAGQVGYKVIATLKADKDTPIGPLKGQVLLKTNDPSSPLVPIVVDATIQAPVVVTPSDLNVGAVKVGDTLTRRVVVRGVKPFKVIGVDGLNGTGLTLGNELATQEAAVQTVTFKFQVAKAGEFKHEVKVKTSLQDSPLVVTFEGNASQP